MQLWMFATPVVYPASVVPDRWRWLFSLNPMAGIIGTYRDATLGMPIQWGNLGVSVASAMIVGIVGFWQFRRMEASFADEI
jgi:lipopolysaccharide transport system permease protein